MSSVSSPVAGATRKNFRFRCIACGYFSDAASQDFRCAHCGDLLEITYPSWNETKPNPASLKALWKDRRLSSSLADLSGVWRFRELLPALGEQAEVITLHEGNTPLYQLPRCAGITGVSCL